MPDQIGFGKSSKPHDYQFSFSQLAYNTGLILDKLKIDKAIILGHSMGNDCNKVYFAISGTC